MTSLLDSSTIPLLVHGQGVFIFEKTENGAFNICGDSSEKLHVVFSKKGVRIYMLSTYNMLPGKYTEAQDAPHYWLSLDSQNMVIHAGVGEPRLETAIYTCKFSEESKKFLEGLHHIEPLDNIKPLKFLRDPITSSVPLKVKDMHGLTMDDVASNKYMPMANLSLTSQKLYNCIAGPKFVLNSPDFPDFYKAIEYSIATPGRWCFETLKKKASEFNKDKPNIMETYLRITLGQNNGESPGIPYVMEIWPKGHFSPVHSHAGAEAVIRVLEGDIHVDLYPFLASQATPFGSGDFTKDDVMWISPTLNQIHQLKNKSTSTCITIQCYMYDGTDNKHYDYFDYLDGNGAIQQYQPDSDMDFIAFKERMKQEWKSKMRSCWG